MAKTVEENCNEVEDALIRGEFDSLKNLNTNNEVNTDSDFVDSNIKFHMEAYTNILKEYSFNLQKINKSKRCNKIVMFWFSVLVLFAISTSVICLSFVLINKYDNTYDNIFNYFIYILPMLISFVTAYLVIPQIITNYLFNKEEDKYMSDIVINTQKLDYNLYRKKPDDDISKIIK